MRDPSSIINELDLNRAVFDSLLRNAPPEQIRWKPSPHKWSLLEVVCHLHDVEHLDFRSRISSVLENPTAPWPPINPLEWVVERMYLEQNMLVMLDKFLAERTSSVSWLRSLESPSWNNVYQHPKEGPLSARLLLHSWLAHDYFHFRQIARLKYAFLRETGGQPLDYAGPWGE